MAVTEVPADKKPWQSRTIILGIVAALLPLIPSVNAWVSAHAEAYGMITGGVFAFLRMITNGKVTIS